MDFASLLAVLLSPVIAVGVTLWYQTRKEKRDAKRWIAQTLMATRHSQITDEAVRALNLIDLVYYDSPSVRRLWREYFEMLSNEGLNNPIGWATRQKKNLEMLTEMATVLGYGKAVTHLDVDRVYYPQGLGDQAQRAREISDELLRVLRGSQGLQVLPKAASELGEGKA
jgi:Family of unknown function (DUF6680)